MTYTNVTFVTTQSGENVRRIAVFADVGNLYHTCIKKFNRKVNFKKLLEWCNIGNSIAIAYGVSSTNDKGFKKCLYDAGFKEINFKTPKVFSDGTKKADQDGQMMTDIFRRIEEFDTIILCSADGDFAPCLQLCRERGKEVIVIGCEISHELKDVAIAFQEIGEDFLEPNTTTK